MHPIRTLLPIAALAATLTAVAQDAAPTAAPQPATPVQAPAPTPAPTAPAAQPAPAPAAPAAAPAQPAPTIDPAAAAQAEVRERIELTRDALEKWVETRRTIGVERRDWALGKDLLDSRIDVLDRELKTLADRKRDALAQEAGTLKDASAQLAAMAAQLEAKVKGLVKRFPTPLAEKLKPLTQRLPEDPATTALPLAVRFQNIVGIINEANRFNREITQSSEIRKLADGSSVEVTAVYLGLAQGYYVGAGGRIAGIGRGAPEGWTWTESNDNGPAIERIVAILRNQKPAAFVPIPVKTN